MVLVVTDNDGDIEKCYVGHHLIFSSKQRRTPDSRAVALLDSGSDLFPEVQMGREERQVIWQLGITVNERVENTQEIRRLAESKWAEIFCKTLCVKWLSLACRQEERKTAPNLFPVETQGKGKGEHIWNQSSG